MLRKKRKLLKSEKGLTLIELLAVIVILAIIAAIAIPAIANIIQNSKIDAVKADAIQVLEGAKLYVSNNGVPSGDLTSTDLDKYVDRDVSKLNNDYKVTVTKSGDTITYQFTGTGKAGNDVVTFNKATLNDINSAAKGDTTIPK
ncbi:prepilin-type N-terminal cleavage/methylation domain-containing protein [Heyndrickxia ginsengihumi]|uniref:prepilin-type N-terminal cleavage/methylation domain-containing protein n=1 Tax=Heyndrickxia ginsengihumi TaxID=363870 RepID=UPI003D1D491F